MALNRRDAPGYRLLSLRYAEKVDDNHATKIKGESTAVPVQANGDSVQLL